MRRFFFCTLRALLTFAYLSVSGKDISVLYSQMRLFFPVVTIVKPKSSRSSSLEAFILCQDYTPPAGYVPNMIDPMMVSNKRAYLYLCV